MKTGADNKYGPVIWKTLFLRVDYSISVSINAYNSSSVLKYIRRMYAPNVPRRTDLFGDVIMLYFEYQYREERMIACL